MAAYSSTKWRSMGPRPPLYARSDKGEQELLCVYHSRHLHRALAFAVSLDGEVSLLLSIYALALIVSSEKRFYYYSRSIFLFNKG